MKKYHPMVIFLFFVGVAGMTMLIMHPVYLIISLAFACALHILSIKATSWKHWAFYIGLFLSMALVNPLINQEGQHIVWTFGLRVITLEAITYGLVIAMMLVAVLFWFQCYNEMMTSDKFLYVFGKLVPTFALTVMITLSLIPKFQQQLQKIAAAQKAIGFDYQSGPWRHRLNNVVRMLSILLTWALENAVETADVMKARGYGLPGKTTFSNYTLQRRDYLFLTVFTVLFLLVLIGIVKGTAQFSFYPTWQRLNASYVGVVSMLSFFVLCSLPIVVEIKERLKWR